MHTYFYGDRHLWVISSSATQPVPTHNFARDRMIKALFPRRWLLPSLSVVLGLSLCSFSVRADELAEIEQKMSQAIHEGNAAQALEFSGKRAGIIKSLKGEKSSAYVFAMDDYFHVQQGFDGFSQKTVQQTQDIVQLIRSNWGKMQAMSCTIQLPQNNWLASQRQYDQLIRYTLPCIEVFQANKKKPEHAANWFDAQRRLAGYYRSSGQIDKALVAYEQVLVILDTEALPAAGDTSAPLVELEAGYQTQRVIGMIHFEHQRRARDVIEHLEKRWIITMR